MHSEVEPFWTSWSFSPGLLSGLLFASGLYAIGWLRLYRRHPAATPPAWRAWSFGSGILLMAVALFSPVAEYSEFLFTMHMTQHVLMLVVAPALLLLGAPLLPILWGLPGGVRQGAGSFFTTTHPLQRFFSFLVHPYVATGLFLAVMGIWHFQKPYDAAQGSTLAHDLEHIAFLSVGIIWWWPLIHPTGGRRGLGYGLAMVYLLPPVLVMTVIGAVLVFAEEPLYTTYLVSSNVWGLTPLEDQHLGGIIMWIPTKLLYLVVFFVRLSLFMAREEQAAEAAMPRHPNGEGVI